MRWLLRRAAAMLVVVAVYAETSTAGGGPENLLLVVNQNSDASKTIANHYVRLRDIPPSNVLYLDWKGGTASTSSEVFREQILRPITEAITSRKLAVSSKPFQNN